MQSKAHWENMYTRRAATEVSWYQAHARRSLKLIREAGVSASAALIDVGGGASTLVDDLLAQGHDSLTVLDLSGAALAAARARLGERAARVHWVEGDILEADLPAQAYDVWHDRAVFHFLTAPDERRAYVRKVRHAVRPGGLVIVATFAEDGPTECSGLPVMRYSADELHAEFGESFRLLAHEREAHHTPSGKEQRFVYCVFRKTGPGTDTAHPSVAETARSPDTVAGHGAVDAR
jgi:SAM-dependent methyltransferase